MSISVSNQTIQMRHKFQGALTGHFLSHPGWHMGSLQHWFLEKVKCGAFLSRAWKCRLSPSIYMQLVTEAEMANSIVTKNSSRLKRERLPGTSNCSPVCYIALSVTTPESKPSLGLTANGAFYSNSYHSGWGGKRVEEWVRSVGVSYGPRT